MNKQAGAEKRQLTSLNNNKMFRSVFSKIVKNDNNINVVEQEFILSCAIIMFRHYDLDKRFLSYFKLGYYIILKYSLLFKDMQPLYDVSLQIGFYPISDFLIKNKIIEANELEEILINNSIAKKYVSSEGYIETLEQSVSSKSIRESLVDNISYIAPTSYGKSSIIKDIIKDKNFNRIAIIVPTKSLLIQTYNDIKTLGLDYKLLLHDEMFLNNPRFIAIMTQERATRLILKNNTNFEVIFIDEAHNLMNRDIRSYILSRLIQINNKKNAEQKLIYLSPLIDDPQNIQLKNLGKSTIYTRKIRHDLKVVDLYLYDNSQSYIYDKFTGETYDLNKPSTFYKYIIQNSTSKNFIYHNRPKLIEQLSIELSGKLPDIPYDKEIEKIIKTLKEEVHNSFYLVSLIRKGIVYLHGKIPNVIKEYLEFKFKTVQSLSYIIANTVILEGINLPIDSLFITSTYGMRGKELTNLIGRVNRLNYVFANENLNLLISKIHFLNSEKYQGKNDIQNKMKLLRDHSFDDIVNNPLLVNYDIEKLSLKDEDKQKRKAENKIILNASDIILSETSSDLKAQIKKYLVENSIDSFYYDIDLVTELVYDKITSHYKTSNNKIVDIISTIFITDNETNLKDFEIERLKNKKAIDYYNYFLEVTQKQTLRQKINSTVNYFQRKALTDDPQLYMGTSYGEEIRYSNQYNNKEYVKPVYVNLKNANYETLVNWAIVKIKIEEDFVSYKLNKFLVFLYDFKLIPESYYFNYVYGTDNPKLIELIRFGLNVSIVNTLNNDRQLENISFDDYGNLTYNKSFNQYLATQTELFKFEVEKFL